MKTVLFSFLVLFLFTISCKKEQLEIQSDEQINLAEQIVGKWELRELYSGMGETTIKPAGNGQMIEFSKSNYTLYYYDPFRTGPYKLVKDTSWRSGQIKYFVLYDTNEMPLQWVEIKIGKLYFHNDDTEGGGSKYERVR